MIEIKEKIYSNLKNILFQVDILNICKKEKYPLPSVYQGLYNVVMRYALAEKIIMNQLKKEKILFFIYNNCLLLSVY